MNNAKVVGHEIRQCVQHEQIDILCMQEPHVVGGRIAGMATTTRIVTGADENIKSAIGIFNSDLEVLKISQYCNAHCVCVQVRSQLGDFYLVSIYFQYSDDPATYISMLRKILDDLKNHPVIITGDFNARSRLWHDKETNDRGVIIEEFLSSSGLYLVNEAGQPSTYRHNGESNIDLTVITGGLLKRVSNWSVKDNWTSSDHRSTKFNLSKSQVNNELRASDRIPRYALKRANWERFDSILETSWLAKGETLSVSSQEDVNRVENDITGLLISACDKSIPKKRSGKMKLTWWTPALSKKRETVHKLRKVYQRETDPLIRQNKKRIYSSHRNEYVKAINETSQRSLEKFVTDHGNAEPWGFVYKYSAKKLKNMEILSTLVNSGGQTTTCWEDTTKCLLNTLLPDDDNESDTNEQRSVRSSCEIAPTNNDEVSFSNEEATSAVMSMKRGKAPGLDNVEVEVVQRAWPIIGPIITSFMNACLSKGIFPKAWKNGRVIIIRKGGDRDPTDPKAYRPIMLLPVLGKLLEKLVTGKLLDVFQGSGGYSDKQFGFRRGRSTEDAMVEMINIVKESGCKYALGVFLDVSGAFDNLWWPSIMRELKQMSCPANLYSLVSNYFSERIATVVSNHGTLSKSVNKGCPQGSILGPHLWNVVFNSSMHDEFREVAFADDKIMIFDGNSRQAVQEKAQRGMDSMVKWCNENKMELSSTKTVMLQLKGSLDIRRPPLVYVGSQRIKMVSTVRWLGVDFDERLGVTTHVKRIAENSKKVFYALRRVAKETWGLKQSTLMTIYQGLVVAAMTYACAGWAGRMNCHHRRTLLSAQRSILLGITKAYRTVSTDAVSVLAGAIIMDVVLNEKIARYRIRKSQDVSYGSVRVQENQYAQLNKNHINKEIRKVSIALWQDRWNGSENGRTTFGYLPNIQVRLEMKMALSSPWVQVLTGHGKFAEYMHKIKLADSSSCECGHTAETADHILYDCNLAEEARSHLIGESNVNWPASKLVLMLPTNVKAFKRFCEIVLCGVRI